MRVLFAILRANKLGPGVVSEWTKAEKWDELTLEEHDAQSTRSEGPTKCSR